MPSFFDEVDSSGIVESHIQQVLKLEKDQAKTIMESYQGVRRDLVDRLSRYPAGSFTAQHLRGVLAQVQGAITALNKSLSSGMVDGAQEAAMMGVDHLLKEMNKFDADFLGAVTPINLNAALIARDTSQFLLTKYKTNLDSYGQNLYTHIANGLFSATIGETSFDEVVGRVSKFFNGEEWRVHRIVRTELHHIYSVGKLNGLREVADEIPDMLKTLVHPMDARTGNDSKYAASLKLVAKIDEPFKYVWDGKVREFMVPPDRPNDRSSMVPYRKEWGDSLGDSLLPGRDPVP